MKICSLRNLDFWRTCKRKNNRGKLSPRTPFRNSCKLKVVMKLFEAACCFCWCGVFMRQGDTHTFIAFYIMSFINWTTIFIVQIIICFHLVSVLLHSCCITLISRSTCSFTDAGNFKWAVVLRQIFRQIVSIRVMTLINTNVVASRRIKREEVLPPVAVRRSKTP